MHQDKVLIIKTGYSETLDKEISKTSSLGDVLRTTVILHLFKNDHITWLVDERAFPLLYNNPYINRILIYNLSSALQLKMERFDTVINFEKVPGICALSDSINAWRRFGFRFDEIRGEALAYDNAEEVHSISQNIELKKFHKKYWQEGLYEMVGKNWEQQEYILGYQPSNEVKYDVGLNWAVGKTYPTKAWPKNFWESLAAQLEPHYSISWQQGLEDIYQYIDWVNSCRVLVSSDSLGLHIGIALRKKLAILYGPTLSGEVYLYGLGKSIAPSEALDCMPCFKPVCENDKFCMELITPEMVFDALHEILENRP